MGLYMGYIGIMEKKMESTMGLGFWGFRGLGLKA